MKIFQQFFHNAYLIKLVQDLIDYLQSSYDKLSLNVTIIVNDANTKPAIDMHVLIMSEKIEFNKSIFISKRVLSL